MNARRYYVGYYTVFTLPKFGPSANELDPTDLKVVGSGPRSWWKLTLIATSPSQAITLPQ